MSSFKNGGIFLAFFACVLFMVSDVHPNPTNMNMGSSGGGYGGGGLSMNKMIFTVQDARKLVANKMKGFGGGSSKKKPPPKKQKPKGYGHSSEKGDEGYGREHSGYSSEIEYHVADPYDHSSGGHKRELPYKKTKSEVKTSEKKEVGWTPIVKSIKGLPKKQEANDSVAYMKATGLILQKDNQNYQVASTVPIYSLADKKLINKPTLQKYYETRPNSPSITYRNDHERRF